MANKAPQESHGFKFQDTAAITLCPVALGKAYRRVISTEDARVRQRAAVGIAG